jgi:hypothetical protein
MLSLDEAWTPGQGKLEEGRAKTTPSPMPAWHEDLHRSQRREGGCRLSPATCGATRIESRSSKLEVIDSLLGHDGQVINRTAWRNPPGPEAIPHPIFVVATHLYFPGCPLGDG